MGKEQELLEAARSGNFAVVEKILSQRAKKTGPLASLRRGPGANTQDQSGYTSLHHSALNGHKDIVSVLLAHEASTNVVDNKGSTPLHLAAWTGNTEIVKLLLVQGPSTPNVNLSNHDHETALHSAAQYGHTEVVSLLLQHGSDASVRNLKEESPLDLAAQYGRLETVELLVKHRPELLRNNTQKHSPLHLASRNGHKHVVKVLLEAGFDVNLVTETGSALHEAALFGKIEVVKHLLDYRVDVNIEDCKKRTVFDLLDDLNTAISKQTRRLIKEHTTLVMTDDEMESPPSISPPPGFLSDSGSYANVLVPERPPHLHGSHMTGALGGGVPLPPFLHPASAAGRSPPRSSSSPGSELFGYYEVPPPPRLANPPSSNSGSKRSSGASDQLYQTPPLAKSHDSSFESRSRSPSLYETPSPAQMPGGGYNVQDSAHSSAASLQRVSPLPIDSSYHLQGQRTSGMYRASRSLESDAILYEIPPPSAHSQMPPGKRLSDPYQNQEPGSTSTSWTGGYLPMSTFQSHPSAAGQGNKPQPPAKPPRRSIAPVSPVGKYPPRSGYEYLCLATSAPGSGRSSASRGSKMSRDDYVDMKRRTSYEGGGQSDNELEALDRGIVTNGGGTGAPNTNTPSPFSTLYDDIASGKLSSGLETNSYTNYLLTKSTPTLLTHGRSASDTSAVVGVQRNQHRISNYHPQIPSKPSTLDLKAKRATVQIPLSPTHYNQPPTPDFPPPSPGTAVTGILEKIRPLSQDSSDEGLEEDIQTVEYRNSKRLSRDIETLTDEEICATVEGNGQIRLTLRKESKSVATDNIQEVQEDNPFAGLCRGSIIPHKYRDGVKSGGKSQHSKRPKNVYENVTVTKDGRALKMVSLVSGKDSGGGGGGGGGQNASDTKGEANKRGSSSLAVMSPFDENAEWAEIADIMASFGSGIARESVFAQEIEEHFANVLRKESELNSDGPSRFTTIEEWLRIVGLSEYENILVINGFDDVNFLGNNMLEEQDLLDIGVSSAEHRRILVNSARKLPVAVKPLLDASSQEKLSISVNEWLRSLRLSQYQEVFHRNGFTDMDRVAKLWEVELNTVLEITKIGHQKRILASLGDRSTDRNFTDLGDLDLTKLNLTLCELGLDDSSDDVSTDSFLFKDYSNVTPRSTPNSADSLDSGASSISDTLRIRPPTQLMSEPGTTVSLTSPQQVIGAMPSFLTAQWRHDADTLVQNCCNYTAQYLGSTLVKELKGMESSRKSIQKLKTSTRDIAKIPYVILSISHQGVKFIDAQSQQVVCEHEIRNIHCACQDAEDLDHFAYITKEHQTNNHYCHVFSAQNTDLATEIILTLGQAFEVAYQLALRDKSKGDVSSSKDTSAAPSPVPPPSSSSSTSNQNSSQMLQAAANLHNRQFVSQLNVQLVPKTHHNGDAPST